MAEQRLDVMHHFPILVENFFLLNLRNLKVLEKVSSLVHFDCFSLKAWFFGIIYLNFFF